MTTVLVTAFGPYDRWEENGSWLALVELTKQLPTAPLVTTRRYPVEFVEMRRSITTDLQANYDFAIFLGQAPGYGRVTLESVGLNVRGDRDQLPEQYTPLLEGGPLAYASQLPLGKWSEKIRRSGVPCQVSYHAGTYLCNAALYLSHYLAQQMQLKTRSLMIHVPLDPAQVLEDEQDNPTLTRQQSASAVRIILEEMAAGEFDEMA